MGYHQAGFDVVGVDINPQKRYPFPFIQGDALEILERIICGESIETNQGAIYCKRDFAAIHASPPCQAYTALRHIAKKEHPDLLGPTRDLLEKTGLPWIIENVPGAPINAMLMLCGTMFGLQTICGAELQRHRYFETNWWFGLAPECRHNQSKVIGVYEKVAENAASGGRHEKGARARTISVHGDHPRDSSIERENRERRKVSSVHGGHARDKVASHENEKRRTITVTGHTARTNVERNHVRETFSVQDARDAMGIDWMGMKELSQAIPPAYTRYIGDALIEHLKGLEVAS
jgi:DNA (cytosine-5)-methyltransferase 1